MSQNQEISKKEQYNLNKSEQKPQLSDEQSFFMFFKILGRINNYNKAQ